MICSRVETLSVAVHAHYFVFRLGYRKRRAGQCALYRIVWDGIKMGRALGTCSLGSLSLSHPLDGN